MQMRRGFKRTAQWQFTILVPDGRIGKVAATAKMSYRIGCVVKGIYIPQRSYSSHGPGGERTGSSEAFQILPESVAQIQFDSKCRVVRGDMQGGTWKESDEYAIKHIRREPDTGKFYLLHAEIEQSPRGDR